MNSILNALESGRLFELSGPGKESALEFLASALSRNSSVQIETDAVGEIKRRESECNTGIGMGVAVPHIASKLEGSPLFCVIGWAPKGIDYGAEDQEEVHLIFMYGIPAGKMGDYLKEISSLSKAIQQHGGIGSIGHAPSLDSVKNQLSAWIRDALGETKPSSANHLIKLETKAAGSTAGNH